jgi:hypothetical protein
MSTAHRYNRLTAGERPELRHRPGARWLVLWLEVALAVAAYVVLCVLVLKRPPLLVEPDDQAYRGSIVGITDGYWLTLSTAQMHAVAAQVAGMGGLNHPSGAGGVIAQWARLAEFRWISQKDPGFPFLAATFQALGIIRWAQLFYGALGCAGLFIGARRWLGPFGGAAAVGLYSSSGAALLFAWREYMPTFTEASLIAAGTGLLLWAVLATEAQERRRIWVGLAAFIALEAAVFSRYTNIVVLACAVIAVLIAWRMRGTGLPLKAVCWWAGSVVVFGAGAAVFNSLVYGGPLKSGYRPGEITFALSAIGPNLRYMPAHLMNAMPFLILGLLALAWIIGAWAWSRRASATEGQRAQARRDLLVAAALFASWLAVWGLYAAYTWTAHPNGGTLQSVRFYVPALGAISLLGAWLVTRLPGPRAGRPAVAAIAAAAVIAGMFTLGAHSYSDMLSVNGGHVAKICGGRRPAPVVGQNGPGTGKPPATPAVHCPPARAGDPARR